MVAGLQKLHAGVDGGESAAKAKAVGSALNGCDRMLEGMPRRILGAAVFVAFVHARRLLGIGGSLVDWRHYRAR